MPVQRDWRPAPGISETRTCVRTVYLQSSGTPLKTNSRAWSSRFSILAIREEYRRTPECPSFDRISSGGGHECCINIAQTMAPEMEMWRNCRRIRLGSHALCGTVCVECEVQIVYLWFTLR